MVITIEQIEQQFEDAAITLRRLPDPPGSGPKGYGSGWPPYVQEAKYAYGYEDARMRVVPSASDIAKMDEALEWLALVNPKDAKIVWMRAEGRRWRHVCIHSGCVRQTAWRRWVAALKTIENRLNGYRGGRKSTKRANKTPKSQKTLNI